MAHFITRASSKADREKEELLLELETLNQALQSRGHTRSKSVVSNATSPLRASEPKSSCKRPALLPRPSFKVPFRSTSISCDRPRRLLSSSSAKHSQYQHPRARKDATIHVHPEKERAPPPHKDEGIEHSKNEGFEHSKDEEHGLQQQKINSELKQQSDRTSQKPNKNKGFQLDQIHQRKSIWSWKPLRAFSHMILGSHCRFNVLFSLQVQRIESLPASMNGFSLIVMWICKSHCLQTKPSRIVNGIAVFEEALQFQCTIFSTHCSPNISRYDAKPSTLSIMTTGLDKLELAKHHVDLSSLLSKADANGSQGRDNFHDTSYQLSGMATGGTLIAKFCYNLGQKNSSLANHGTRFTIKKTKFLNKSFPLLIGGTPFVESKHFSPPHLLECGAAVHHCHSMGHLNDSKWDALEDFFARDEGQEAVGLHSDNASRSFEFQPPFKDNHVVEFSFSDTHFLTRDESILHDDRPPYFSHSIHVYDDTAVKGEGSKSTHELPEQLKLQKPCYSSDNKAPTGSLSFEVAKCLRKSKKDFDEDLDSVAEDFLNMLGIGLDAGHHNSEEDLESPRERLLRQFEDDSFFMRISQ